MSQIVGHISQVIGPVVFITAFLGGKKISKKEAKLLKKMIDEHKEG